MQNLKIVDCTLRDGGYVNNFSFGRENIISILSLLHLSKVDFIECGFLDDNEKDFNKTIFNTLESINGIIPSNELKSKTFAMFKCGMFNARSLPSYCKNYLQTLRIIFKKNDAYKALNDAALVMDKGYKVSINLTFVSNYTKSEIISFVKKVNNISPYAFYFVDSTGSLTPKRVKELTLLLDSVLDDKIVLGFHAHNNMDLSYTNTIEFIGNVKKRQILTDVCTGGMGRGAGNLDACKFLEYLNNKYCTKYDIKKYQDIWNNYILPVFLKYPWGPDSNYVLTALYKCHPDYAKYLMKYENLSRLEKENILKSIPKNYRCYFDEKLIRDKLTVF